MTDNREAILQAILAALQTIDGISVERNPQRPVLESITQPAAQLFDGSEELAPANGARCNMRLRRWRMSPVIKVVVKLRATDPADRAGVANAVYWQILEALSASTALGPAPGGLLVNPDGWESVQTDALYAEDNTGFMALQIVPSILYDKTLP